MYISGKCGMEIEYEEKDINSSDVYTERELLDTGTETHFIIITTGSLGLNKSQFAQHTKLLM